MLSFSIVTAPQSFCCRWCVVRSRPRNPLFRCVKSRLLLL